ITPLPTRPIDDAGPLKGNTPPILISVAEIPGSSAASAGPLKSNARAATVFHFTNIARPPKRAPFRGYVAFVNLQFFFRTSQALRRSSAGQPATSLAGAGGNSRVQPLQQISALEAIRTWRAARARTLNTSQESDG